MKANMHSVVFTPQGKNLSALTLPVPRSPFSRVALGPADGGLRDGGKGSGADTGKCVTTVRAVTSGAGSPPPRTAAAATRGAGHRATDALAAGAALPTQSSPQERLHQHSFCLPWRGATGQRGAGTTSPHLTGQCQRSP